MRNEFTSHGVENLLAATDGLFEQRLNQLRHGDNKTAYADLVRFHLEWLDIRPCWLQRRR